ncbi:hypothetical protein B0H15DRAFT_982632 [Mycena belliarum]|uniref:Uncharacterized protein n=1 Tax=Mycena belliarum TaxID=1033014 RepID=A0AAD6U5U8_9AGAR|nr:hypothetical protein B0H15DRAFT_982632 [Mycena belliae]
MVYKKLGDSIPFLKRADSRNEKLCEKDFDPDEIEEIPRIRQSRPRGQPLLSRFVGWPVVVILGQLVLQILGWGLFLAVKVRGEIPLSLDAALWVKNNPHMVTLLATLISTTLAGFSSLQSVFDTWSKRQHLYAIRRVSSATLEMACRVNPLLPRDWCADLWVWWTTLITPVTITISSPLSGSELDLSSPILHNLSRGVLGNCTYDSEDFASMGAGQLESGYTSAKTYFGYPSILTLMDQTFNGSTGGILPASLKDVNTSTWFTSSNTTTILPRTKMDSSSRVDGLSANYSMEQQGFTANVSCHFQNLTNETIPDLTLSQDTVANWTRLSSAQVPVTFMAVSTLCPEITLKNLTYAYLEPDSNGTLHYLSFIACTPGDSNFRDGIYGWLSGSVCTVVPQVTTVSVDYGASINARQPSKRILQDIRDPAGISAMQSISWMFFYAQAPLSNAIGDQLASLAIPDDKTSELIEQYFTGAIEYSASVFRACLSGTNATFSDGVPANMSIPTHGTFNTETVGWAYKGRETQWILLPGTFIALATVVVVLVALVRHPGSIPRESGPFDPSDPLHLMAAAAAGGLHDTFHSLETDELKEREKLNVVLTSIPGRGPALVRAEEYQPIFSDAFSPRSPYGI